MKNNIYIKIRNQKYVIWKYIEIIYNLNVIINIIKLYI